MNDAFRALLDGNDDHVETYRDGFDEVQDGQCPDAVTVCCSDSRVLQDGMWGNEEPGQVFTVGNIGNRVHQHAHGDDVVSGDVLYPVAHAGTETIVVVGHTSCGAVTATYRDITEGLDEPSGIQYCIDQLEPLIRDGVEELPDGLENGEAVNHLVEYNVDRQVAFLQESPDIPEDVEVYGVVYDFQDVYSQERGKVHVINVNGERDVGTLREAYPDVADRINRVWER